MKFRTEKDLTKNLIKLKGKVEPRLLLLERFNPHQIQGIWWPKELPTAHSVSKWCGTRLNGVGTKRKRHGCLRSICWKQQSVNSRLRLAAQVWKGQRRTRRDYFARIPAGYWGGHPRSSGWILTSNDQQFGYGVDREKTQKHNATVVLAAVSYRTDRTWSCIYAYNTDRTDCKKRFSFYSWLVWTRQYIALKQL